LDTREIKAAPIKPTSRVDIKDIGKTETIRTICYFSDDTIGAYGVGNEKVQLKIYQTNPLKHLTTYVIPPNEGRQLHWNVTPLKIADTYIFLDSGKKEHGLAIYDIKNRNIGTFLHKGGTFELEKAIQLNSTCFAVPHLSDDKCAAMIHLFKLEKETVKEFKKIYLTRHHYDFDSGFESKDDAAKKQNAELPFNIDEINHLERLTDDSFIVHGVNGHYESGSVVLKCNFNQDTITELISLPTSWPVVRVLNPKKLLSIVLESESKPHLQSQVWELSEDAQATLKFEETIMQKDQYGEPFLKPGHEHWAGEVQCLPAEIGFVHQTRGLAEPMALHLFGKPSLVPVQTLSFHSVFVTKSGLVYTNDNRTYLCEILLDDIIKEQRLNVKNTSRTEIFTSDVTQQELLKSTRLPEVLIGLIKGYVESKPELPTSALISPTKVDGYIEKLFLIIKDDKYLPRKYAEQVSALLEEKQAASVVLKKLKDIVKKYVPQGIAYALFSKDGRTEQEKLLHQLVMQLDGFPDLITSPLFEQLLEDWNRFHHLPRRSIWEH